MTTAYSPLLGLALPVQGELSGTWGDTVNNYITGFLDAAVAGTQTLSTDANVTLTKTTGTALGSTSSQYAVINCTGARTAIRTITAPAASKTYAVINATTGGFGVKLVGAGPTTGVTIAAGTQAFVVWNGSDFVILAGTAAFALKGANSDITSLTGLTTALSVLQGGTGATTAAGAPFALKGANTDITSLAAPALGAATATTQGGTSNGTLVATTGMVQSALRQAGKVLQVQTYTSTGGTTNNGSPTNVCPSGFVFTPISTSSSIIVSVTGNMSAPAVGTAAPALYTCIGFWNGSVWAPGSQAAIVLSEEFGTTYSEHVYSPFAIHFPFSNNALTVRQFDVMGWTGSASVPVTVDNICCVITEVQN